MITAFFRSLPEFKGKRRLLKWMFKDYLKSAKDVQVRGRLGCQYILPNIRENVAFSIFINGIYEKDTIDFLSGSVRKNGVFLDLGMNIGSISIPLSMNRPDVRVLGVEASPWVLEYLNKNIQLNKLESRVKAVNYALYDQDGVILPFYSPQENFGSGSLSGKNLNTESIPVESIKIDSLLSRLNEQQIDFVKIDIEGFEYYAFKGAAELLSRKNAPDILFEFGDWNEKKAGLKEGTAQQLLLDYGYKLYVRENGTLKGVSSVLTSGFYMILASKKSMPEKR